MWKDGRMDKTELTVAFRDFANAPTTDSQCKIILKSNMADMTQQIR